MINQGYKVDGLSDLTKMLADIGAKSLKRGIRSSVVRGSLPIVKAARKMVPIRTGTLKKALTRKYKRYQKGYRYSSIVGANRDVVGTLGNAVIKPFKYQHLVDLRTHFLTRALQDNTDAINEKMRGAMKDVLDKDWGKKNIASE